MGVALTARGMWCGVCGRRADRDFSLRSKLGRPADRRGNLISQAKPDSFPLARGSLGRGCGRAGRRGQDPALHLMCVCRSLILTRRSGFHMPEGHISLRCLAMPYIWRCGWLGCCGKRTSRCGAGSGGQWPPLRRFGGVLCMRAAGSRPRPTFDVRLPKPDSQPPQRISHA